MSKYIIEIPDYVPFILLIGEVRGKFITKVVPVAELEELNSDYINEHFSDLQDTAYQKGFEDGKKSKEKGCEGCKYELCGDTEDPCWHCRKSYKDKYEPAPHSDRIEAGKGEPCIIDEQTRQALNSAISALAEAMDRIREKLEVFND